MKEEEQCKANDTLPRHRRKRVTFLCPDSNTIPVAILDTKDSSITLVAVPDDEDIEDWLDNNYADFDSNCTYQVINTAFLFGTKVEFNHKCEERPEMPWDYGKHFD